MIILICWKEFKGGKMQWKGEVTKEVDEKTALAKMQQFNAEGRKTTTDYSTHNLDKLFSDKNFDIVAREPTTEE